jgi:GxxExxY protein
MGHEPIPPEDEELAKRVIGAAIEVHRTLGPGFLERVSEEALRYELTEALVPFERQKRLFVPYKKIVIHGHRIDLLVGDRIILELKCVDDFSPIHQAQLISCLKATGLRLGRLINFKVILLKDGIKRIVL